MITGWGPAALFGDLFGRSGIPAVGPTVLAEVPALYAELLTAAGQDVLAGGTGALGPRGALRGSWQVSVLAGSLCGEDRQRCQTSLDSADSTPGLTLSEGTRGARGRFLSEPSEACLAQGGGLGRPVNMAGALPLGLTISALMRQLPPLLHTTSDIQSCLYP